MKRNDSENFLVTFSCRSFSRIFFSIATLFTPRCQHNNSNLSLNNANTPVTIYPNFICVNKRDIFAFDDLHHSRYMYLGNNVAIEHSILDKRTAQIIHHDFSMMGIVASINQEAFNRRWILSTCPY